MVDRKGFAGKISPFINTFKQLLFALLFLSSLEGAGSCSKTQFNLVYPNGSMSCADCERCPPGQGLSHECGTSIPSDAMVICKPCTQGKSFSNSFDTSSCSPCAPPCFKDQVVLQNCTAFRNIKCAKQCYSKDSYYESMYVECRTCSRCCGDDGDIVEDECKKKLGSASNSICSFHSSVNRCDTTTMSVHSTAVGKDPTYSSAIPSNVTTLPTQDYQNSAQLFKSTDLPKSQAGCIAVFVGVPLGVLLVVGCATYFLCRRRGCRFTSCYSSIEAGAYCPNNIPETTTLMHRKDERTDGNFMKGDLVELAMEEVQQGSSDPLLEKIPAQVTCESQKEEPESTKKESKPLKSLLEHLKTLQKICEALDTSVPGCGDYQAVAQHYGFDFYQRKSVLEKADGGPSKAMIEGLAASHIELTVEEFALVVGRKTYRQDVVRLLRDYDDED